jgi:transposase
MWRGGHRRKAPLAFVAAIDDPSRIRRSRDVGAYLGLVRKRYQSREVDYVGGISKCGDRRLRTLLYEAWVQAPAPS